MSSINWAEITILGLLLKKPELLGEIEEDLFEDFKNKEMFNLIKSHYLERSTPMSTRELSLTLGHEYEDSLSKLRKALRDPPDEKSVLKVLGNKIVKKSVLDIVPPLSKLRVDNYDLLKESIYKAESLDLINLGTSLKDYFYNEYREDSPLEEEFPTFLSGVYLYKGEIGVIEAPPKKGKTTSLVNISSILLVNGFKVFHWSLEIPKNQLFKRYCYRLLGDRKLEYEKVIKRLHSFGGELQVRDDPYCSFREIRKWVIKGKPDVLIVDYADLVIPTAKSKEGRFGIRETYLALRNLAKEFNIPVWTASQTDVKGAKKMIIGMEDLEEAKIVKAGISSLIISINQTPEEEECNMGRAFIVLSTHGFKGIRKLDMNLEKQYIKEEGKNEDL